MTEEETKWFEDHQNLVGLGWYLNREYGYGGPSLLRFFEKPWKFEDEWKSFQVSEQTRKKKGEANVS